jgi:peptidoglycan/xylan/chitin deacetylase (PgdA/CDA1 family)
VVHVFICVDFDRDYGIPIAHLKHAVSKPIHLHNPELIQNPLDAISIRGTTEAFDLLMHYILEEKLPTTFYFEARSINLFNSRYPEETKLFKHPLFELGVHGYDHEDLTGEETNIKFTFQEEEEVIKKAQMDLEVMFSTKMVGFRAPYMRITDNTTSILSKLGFAYDSSIYQESVCAIQPHPINNGLIEFPVIRTPKESSMKGMYTYLWPLFEGSRNIEDTIENYLKIIENSRDTDSYISINLHSWHFAYNIKQDRYLPTEDIVHNINNFEKLISALKETGSVIFSTPGEWLEKHR